MRSAASVGDSTRRVERDDVVGAFDAVNCLTSPVCDVAAPCVREALDACVLPAAATTAREVPEVSAALAPLLADGTKRGPLDACAFVTALGAVTAGRDALDACATPAALVVRGAFDVCARGFGAANDLAADALPLAPCCIPCMRVAATFARACACCISAAVDCADRVDWDVATGARETVCAGAAAFGGVRDCRTFSAAEIGVSTFRKG
jgi:hypothetical protein